MSDFFNTVFAFREEIEKMRRTRNHWTWEHVIPRESFNNQDLFAFCEAVGCWERGNDSKFYKFYTNNNHPMWKSW